MSEQSYTPSEMTANRAVELWKRMLRSPKYDNMGFSGNDEERRHSEIASAMASMIPSNATEEILEKFGEALKSRLLDESVSKYERHGLSVDYGPDRILRESADAAGLKMEFPWKTTMWVYADRVSVSYGYSAPPIYHYPLGGDRWLVTTLAGSDIDKVIQYVNGGKPEFKIETKENAPSFAI